MKNMNPQIGPDSSIMVNKKQKGSKSGSDSNTKRARQDGGTQQNMNSDRTGNEFQSMEPPHVNAEINSYPHNSGDHGMSNDTYGKVNDNMPGSQVPNFNSGFTRGAYVNDQHGGVGNTGSDFPPQNSQYNQYGQPNMRPGYPPHSNMPRGPAMQPRSAVGGSSMGMVGPGYNSSQPRFPISGPSIQQQGGPTPTLNQLLQNPNPAQRYPGAYGEYGMNQPKGGPDGMTSSQGYPGQQPWGGQPRPGMNPYQQQMQQGNQSFRNPVRFYHLPANVIF